MCARAGPVTWVRSSNLTSHRLGNRQVLVSGQGVVYFVDRAEYNLHCSFNSKARLAILATTVLSPPQRVETQPNLKIPRMRANRTVEESIDYSVGIYWSMKKTKSFAQAA